MAIVLNIYSKHNTLTSQGMLHVYELVHITQQCFVA